MALKLKPGFEQTGEEVEGAENNEEANTNEPTAVVEEHEENNDVAELKKSFAELRAENEKLKERLDSRPTTPQQPVITSSDLEGYSEEQREAIERQTGFKFDDVLRKVRAQERHAENMRTLSSEARANVREAIEEAIEVDPQASKLAKHMREYINDLPLDVRANPDALKRHMVKAKTYAKGAVGYTAPAKRATQERNAPGPDDAPVFEKDGDDVKPGVYDDGVLKIKIEAMPKELASKTKHPSRKNAVQIPTDFDEEPRFR